MSFNLLDQQQRILDRLALLASPVPIVDALTCVDLTDESATPYGVQTWFLKLAPEDQVGRSAKWGAQWSFDLYVDTGRVTPAQKIAAFKIVTDAMAQLIGWEFDGFHEVHTSAGQVSERIDVRITRISFGFTIPVFLAG